MRVSLRAWVAICACGLFINAPLLAQESLQPLPEVTPVSYNVHGYSLSRAAGYPTYDQAYDWAHMQSIHPSGAPLGYASHTLHNGAAFQNALAGNSCGAGCAQCGAACGGGGCGSCCASCCEPTWLINARGLIMTRVQPDPFHFSFESTTPSVCLLRSDDPGLEYWQGGFDINARRRVGCNGGIELNYWWLDPSDDTISLRVPGLVLNTAINLNPVAGGIPQIMLGGQTLDSFFDGAGEHRLRRNNEFHNLEINYTHVGRRSGPNQLFGFSVLGGVRWFRFDEGLQFGSVQSGFNFGDNGGLNEAYYDVDTLNNLIGMQGGGRLEMSLFSRLRIYTDARAGVYYNNAKQRSQVHRGDGLLAYDLASDEDMISLIAQGELGMELIVTDHITGTLGYRVFNASGVALADEQIPAFIHNAQEILDVNTGGSLTLHGAYAGLIVLW